MTTVYGKIDCYSQNSLAYGHGEANIANEYYNGLYQFMRYLESENVVSLTAMYTGSSGTGDGYWNQSGNSHGDGAFSVWRWLPNSERNWDWYMLIQLHSGSNTSLINDSNTTPTRRTNNTTTGIGWGAVLIQAAWAMDSNGDTVNAWNGTTTISSSAKATPVWSGSAGTTTHVLPRVNNLSGSLNTNKDGMAAVLQMSNTPNAKCRYHFLSDGNGILFLKRSNNPGAPANPIDTITNTTYIGPYKMIGAITANQSGKVLGSTGSFGMCMISSRAMESNEFAANTSTFSEYSELGTTNGTNQAENGLFSSADIGVRSVGLATEANRATTTYFPNALLGLTTSFYDERPYALFCEEVGFRGFAGWIDTPLLRFTNGLQTFDVRADGLRAVFGGSNATTERKITTVWSGSNPPGVNMTREGITFKIENYNL